MVTPAPWHAPAVEHWVSQAVLLSADPAGDQLDEKWLRRAADADADKLPAGVSADQYVETVMGLLRGEPRLAWRDADAAFLPASSLPPPRPAPRPAPPLPQAGGRGGVAGGARGAPPPPHAPTPARAAPAAAFVSGGIFVRRLRSAEDEASLAALLSPFGRVVSFKWARPSAYAKPAGVTVQVRMDTEAAAEAALAAASSPEGLVFPDGCRAAMSRLTLPPGKPAGSGGGGGGGGGAGAAAGAGANGGGASAAPSEAVAPSPATRAAAPPRFGCDVCGIASMSSAKQLEDHLRSARHASGMAAASKRPAQPPPAAPPHAAAEAAAAADGGGVAAPSCGLFVTNLSTPSDEAAVREFASRFGRVASFDVRRPKNGFVNVAFVVLDTADAAAAGGGDDELLRSAHGRRIKVSLLKPQAVVPAAAAAARAARPGAPAPALQPAATAVAASASSTAPPPPSAPWGCALCGIPRMQGPRQHEEHVRGAQHRAKAGGAAATQPAPAAPAAAVSAPAAAPPASTHNAAAGYASRKGGAPPPEHACGYANGGGGGGAHAPSSSTSTYVNTRRFEQYNSPQPAQAQQAQQSQQSQQHAPASSPDPAIAAAAAEAAATSAAAAKAALELAASKEGEVVSLRAALAAEREQLKDEREHASNQLKELVKGVTDALASQREATRRADRLAGEMDALKCCPMCMEGAKDAVLLPCKHLTACVKCAVDVLRKPVEARHCPICRTNATGWVQIFV